METLQTPHEGSRNMIRSQRVHAPQLCRPAVPRPAPPGNLGDATLPSPEPPVQTAFPCAPLSGGPLRRGDPRGGTREGPASKVALYFLSAFAAGLGLRQRQVKWELHR